MVISEFIRCELKDLRWKLWQILLPAGGWLRTCLVQQFRSPALRVVEAACSSAAENGVGELRALA
jgi:hypothetical protein